MAVMAVDSRPHVKVKVAPDGWHSRIWLDGVELRGVVEVDFKVSVLALSTVSITLDASVEIEGELLPAAVQLLEKIQLPEEGSDG